MSETMSAERANTIDPAAVVAPEAESISRREANAALVLLTTIVGVSAIDRRLISLLVEPVRAEFHLTDTELGIITGPAYALVAPIMALPLGMLVDRVNRKMLILLSLAFFSAMTFAHGLAVGFISLLMARVGVAIGEAAVDPGSMSVISDYFDGPRRVRAMSILFLSSSIGASVAFLAGGWSVDLFGWRRTCELFAAIGAVLVLVSLFMLKEPRQGLAQGTLGARSSAPGIMETLAFLRHQRAYWGIAFGFAFCFSTITGEVSWATAHFQRSFGVTPGMMGTALAVLTGVCSASGTLVVGALAARISARDVRWNCWLPMIVVLLMPPLVAAILFAPSPEIAFAIAVFPAFLMLSHGGPINAMRMSLAPSRMRGVALAITGIITMAVELLSGPFAIGVLSDLYKPWAGQDSLRFAMLSTTLGWVAAGACFGFAALTLKSDIARADAVGAGRS